MFIVQRFNGKAWIDMSLLFSAKIEAEETCAALNRKVPEPEAKKLTVHEKYRVRRVHDRDYRDAQAQS